MWSCRYDEVLVGAPYYSPVQNPEAGRIYVYRNNAVSSDDNGCTVYCVLKRKANKRTFFERKQISCTVIVPIHLQWVKIILLSAWCYRMLVGHPMDTENVIAFASECALLGKPSVCQATLWEF